METGVHAGNPTGSSRARRGRRVAPVQWRGLQERNKDETTDSVELIQDEDADPRSSP